MNIIQKKVEVFGDSILKGVQVNPQNKRYHVDNHIDLELISSRFSLQIMNRARFGCTVTKGAVLLDKYLSDNPDASVVLMDFGGNDCDFDWRAVSENPDIEHEPHTPINCFIDVYSKMILKLKQKGIVPVLTNLPPIEPTRFFDWFFRDLNKENILRWLGGVNTIYRFQEYYSKTVEEIAKAAGAMLIDLRHAFLKERRIDRFLCEDGIHPSTEGQHIITEAIMRFIETTDRRLSHA